MGRVWATVIRPSLHFRVVYSSLIWARWKQQIENRSIGRKMRAAFETHWMEPIQPNRAVIKWLVDISSQTSYLFVIRGRAIIKPQPIRQRNNRLERLELDVCIIGGNEWEKATRADHGYFLEQKKKNRRKAHGDRGQTALTCSRSHAKMIVDTASISVLVVKHWRVSCG